MKKEETASSAEQPTTARDGSVPKRDEPPTVAELPAVELPKIEELAASLGTPAWLLAAMKHKFGWGIGKRLTEAAFADAAEEVLSIPLGNPAVKEPAKAPATE